MGRVKFCAIQSATGFCLIFGSAEFLAASKYEGYVDAKKPESKNEEVGVELTILRRHIFYFLFPSLSDKNLKNMKKLK